MIHAKDSPPEPASCALCHLLDRVQHRNIPAQQLRVMLRWMDTQPEVPANRWFKRFPELIVCGEGELIKTLLLPSQAATGEEVA